ncbi:hypothetical protein pb186bvf_009343 [Paramecium bursaria]
MATYRDSYEHKENYFHVKNDVTTKTSPLVKMNDRRMSIQCVNPQVVDTFYEIAKKLDRNSQEYLRKVIPIDETKDSLHNTDQIILLNYIKQIVMYLIKTKLEIEDKIYQSGSQTQYETIIQKLESDIRQHIRVEQQLRLFAETAQQKIEELNFEKQQLEQTIQAIEQQHEQKLQEMNYLQKEFNELKLNQRQKKLFTDPISHDQDSSSLQSYTHLYTENSEIQRFSIDKNAPTVRQSANLISKYPISPKNYDNRKSNAQKRQEITSLINSPEKQTKRHEIRAVKQPTFVKSLGSTQIQQPYMGKIESALLSYRSNSQEPLQTYKKQKS